MEGVVHGHQDSMREDVRSRGPLVGCQEVQHLVISLEVRLAVCTLPLVAHAEPSTSVLV